MITQVLTKVLIFFLFSMKTSCGCSLEVQGSFNDTHDIFFFCGKRRKKYLTYTLLVSKAHSVAHLTADPVLASSNPSSDSLIMFVDIDHEIVSKVILPPSTDSRRAAVGNWRNCAQSTG